jgi:nitrile hydratase
VYPLAGWNVDAFRRALERLDRSAYLADGYFGRWLNATELMLIESGLLAPSAIQTRAHNLRGEQVQEPAVSEPAEPGDAPTAEGSLRTVDAAPAFAVGERVGAKNISPAGHTRLPRYVHAATPESSRSSSRRPCYPTRTRTFGARTRSTCTPWGSTRTNFGAPTSNRLH